EFVLEQGGGAAFPGLSFFFGDVFHVGDVGSGLGGAVVEIVADADEGDSVFEELANAGGTEEEEAEDDVVLTGVFDQALGGGVEFGRGVHVGELVLVVKSHRHAEIVLAEEEDVDAGDGWGLGDVFEARGSLDLQGDDAFVVPVAGIAEESAFIHAALGEVDRARADRGILRATHGFAGFGGGVDVGNKDTVGAHVEGLLDAGAVGVSADADHRLCAAVRDAAQHGGKFFISHGAVLGVDEEPVVSAVRELLGDRRTVRVEEQAHLGLAGAQLLFELGSAQCGVGHMKILLEVELKSVPYGAMGTENETRIFSRYDRGTGYRTKSGVSAGFVSLVPRNDKVLKVGL